MSDLGLIEQTGGSPSAAVGLQPSPAAGPSPSLPKVPQVADNTNTPPPTGIAAGPQGPSPQARVDAPAQSQFNAADALIDMQYHNILRLEGSGPQAISPKGAIGRGQIMPGTAAQYGVTREELFDEATNERVS